MHRRFGRFVAWRSFKLRDAYGRNRVGQGMLLARRLVEAGVRFVTIQGYAVPDDRPVSVPDFVETVYHALGLNPKAEHVIQGRPMTMLPEGAVVSELF